MTHQDRVSMKSGSDTHIPYVHGSNAIEQRRLETRTAATAAAFFLPHLRPGMRLLDCGCGVGSITVGLAEAVAPGEVIGVDLQPAQIERAGFVAAERCVGNVRFEIGSVYELAYPDASFDASFAHTLLFHLREPLQALREMRRVLKPGGVVGVADDDRGTFIHYPERPLISELHHLFWQVIRHHGGNPFTGRQKRRLLLEAGFSRVVASPTFAPGGAQGWANERKLEAMAAAVVEWGEHPDAYAAAMGVAAVGWVDA